MGLEEKQDQPRGPRQQTSKNPTQLVLAAKKQLDRTELRPDPIRSGAHSKRSTGQVETMSDSEARIRPKGEGESLIGLPVRDHLREAHAVRERRDPGSSDVGSQ